MAIFVLGCSKNEFNEQDALDAQKELLDQKYQHEIDLETLKQKGVNALQQLVNTAALNQLKVSDSLARASAIAAAKQDYSVAVVDVVSNKPISGADVTVSSQGKVIAAKTNAQGIATFTSLYLFPTSSFLVSKTGYAATQILQKDITLGTAKLWNTTDLSNEISGTLYIETDLTNITPEKVGANVLVTASTNVPNGVSGYYTISFPTYSLSNGTYSLKLPAAPSGYNLTFGQIAANQKLFINATEADPIKTFPYSLPSLTTIKTYFNVNSFNAGVPTVYNAVYLKVAKDKAGKTLSIPVSYNNFNSNQVYVSSINNWFQVEWLNTNQYYYDNNGNYFDFSSYTYPANSKVNVEMVDITGTIVKTAPLLSATTNSNGKLNYSYSPEGGSGIVHLRRDNAGKLVPNAKGVILKAVAYDPNNNLYTLNFNTNLNRTSNSFVNTTYLLVNKGDKKVVNFYYGSGDSREKLVY